MRSEEGSGLQRKKQVTKPLQRIHSGTTVHQGVVGEIKRYIIAHNLEAGQRLPSMAQMGSDMKVSQGALREALKSLQAVGILNIVNGRGVYVINPQMARIQNDQLVRMRPEDIIDTLNIRWMLETEAVRYIIRRASPEQVEMLGDLTRQLVDRFTEGKPTHDEDKAFHLGLYSITNNQALQQVLSAVLYSWSVMWEYPLPVDRPFYDSALEHEQLYLAIRDRDEDRAVQVCELSRRRMVEAVESTLGF